MGLDEKLAALRDEREWKLALIEKLTAWKSDDEPRDAIRQFSVDFLQGKADQDRLEIQRWHNIWQLVAIAEAEKKSKESVDVK